MNDTSSPSAPAPHASAHQAPLALGDLRITVLGSGPSTGVPSVEYGWGECDPDNPRNVRLRPSIFIEAHTGRAAEDGGHIRLLVDASPDLRQQLLNGRITKVDAVLFTHAHADHVHGLDDLRSLNRISHAPLEAWAAEETWAAIEDRFAYALTPIREGATNYYKPTLIQNTYRDFEPFTVAGLEILPIEQDHGFSMSHGFRIGDFAYTADVVRFPERSLAALEGVRAWVLGAFGWDPHPTHAHVDQALEWIAHIGPDEAVLTHMGVKLDHTAVAEHVPDHVAPAYDGMVVTAANVIPKIAPHANGTN